MLTRILGKRLLTRQSIHLPKMVTPCNYIYNMPTRNFQGHLGLDSTANLVPVEFKSNDQVALWKEHVDKKNALSLKTSDEIE